MPPPIPGGDLGPRFADWQCLDLAGSWGHSLMPRYVIRRIPEGLDEIGGFRGPARGAEDGRVHDHLDRSNYSDQPRCGFVNMLFPLFVSSACTSSCITSQCSTSLPPTTRKMSTVIIGFGPQPV
jgi:hypothetical protein